MRRHHEAESHTTAVNRRKDARARIAAVCPLCAIEQAAPGKTSGVAHTVSRML